MTDNSDAAGRLDKAAKAYWKAQKARDDAMAHLVTTMVEIDHDKALSRNELERRSGLSRATVYAALRKAAQ